MSDVTEASVVFDPEVFDLAGKRQAEVVDVTVEYLSFIYDGETLPYPEVPNE